MDEGTVAGLRAWIANGRLLPGTRMPSLRTLAGHLRCTLHAVHRAALALEQEGVLVRRSPRVFAVAGRAPDPEDLGRTLVVLAHLGGLRPAVPGLERTADDNASSHVMAGLEAAARRQGLAVRVFPPDRATLGRFAQLDRRGPRGWAFLHDVCGSETGRALLAAAQASASPVAVWGDTLLPDELATLPCDAVLADHRGGAAALVRHLAGLGARRLLPVLAPSLAERGLRRFAGVWMAERLRGYQEGAQAAGVALIAPQPYIAPRRPADPEAFAEGCTALGGVLAPYLLAAPPADALLAPEDGTATALACAARRLGRELPVAGFDATWRDRPESAWGPPPSASIDQQWAAIGAALAEALLARAADRRRPLVRSLVPALLVADPAAWTHPSMAP